MMLVHAWMDQYGNSPFLGKLLRDDVSSAVQFDCGVVDDIPVGKGREFCESRAPFPNTLLQFETPSNPSVSHLLVLWTERQDGSVVLVVAQRERNKKFSTPLPTVVTIGDDGVFNYKRFGFDANAEKVISRAHAYALNLFYVLGCSNVEATNNSALTALNKKRARAGKYPVLEYKTLVLKVNGQASNGQPQGGSHASPRVHLRRGHVRHLDSGRRVWVQACVVGSTHGMVLKDYRVCA